MNERDTGKKFKRLMISLRGNALEFVDTLQLKVTMIPANSLAQRFGITSNETLYRLKFKTRRRYDKESLDKLIQDLRYLAEKSIPKGKRCNIP